jgi:condensin-2 complex subunit G2
LLDDDPAVRSIAVLGVTRILNTYWEMVPMATTTTLLEIIANDLAWDVQAAPVRVAVCEGLESLLDNALAGPVLAALLPHLAPLLHDTSERVRCAFADLLLRVKGMSMHTATK